MTDMIENDFDVNRCVVKVGSTRKRTVTYWENNNQYEKEELFVSSFLQLPVSSEEDAKGKVEPLLAWLQSALKKNLDSQEALLPKEAA